MVEHAVHIEALGYGNIEAEAEALTAALEPWVAEGELEPSVLVDPARGMLLLTVALDGTDAVEVHEAAMDMWRTAWAAAFPDQPLPARLAVTVLPAGAATNAGANGARP